MERDENFFRGLPWGKVVGICEQPNTTDGGIVVEIENECRKCTLNKCLMFESIQDQNGTVIAKKFTPLSS